MSDFNPLTSPAPKEVMLTNPPLVGALAQIRYPKIMAIRQDDYVARFQEFIRHDYHIYEKEEGFGIQTVQGNVVSAGPVAPVHKFKGIKNKSVTLSEDFVAIDTSFYEDGKSGFLEQLSFVITATKNHINPHNMSRLGIRFVHRLVGDKMNNIEEYVRKDFLPPLMKKGETPSSFSQAMYKTKEGFSLGVHWGWVRANQNFPNMDFIQTINKDSWFLDIDCFQQGDKAFSEEGIIYSTAL
ncbi:MAG: TIGR04255 family protein [Candidatus Zeuxoniibacter abyssi]|nr:MAG: TIGR04255 family protein [Candidatus Persebacteraceae bacterium AB1(2)]